jgi:hypothetical protein
MGRIGIAEFEACFEYACPSAQKRGRASNKYASQYRVEARAARTEITLQGPAWDLHAPAKPVDVRTPFEQAETNQMLHACNDVLGVWKRTSVTFLPVRRPGVRHVEETGRENNRRRFSPGQIAAKHFFHGGFRGEGWPRKFDA